jgi:cytoskeleton protein RodZ
VEAAADPNAALPPGQVLAAERERQGLSRVEMAQRLHMSPSQVEALETGAYSRLPRGPFLRGFVRNYAKALGIDADALLARLAQDSPTEAAPRIVVPSQNIRFDPLGERLSNPYVRAAGLAAVVIALGFAAMYWWLFIRPTPPGTRKVEAPPAAGAPAKPSKPSPATSLPPPSAATSPAATPTTQAAPTTQPSPNMPPPAAASSAAPQAAKPEAAAPAKAEDRKADAAKAAAPAKGEALLQFQFRGESWVEVRDASDKVVFQRLNEADSEASVTGKLPLRIIVGNAEQVSMRYNGRDFPLGPHTKVAVARFTLE